LGHDFIEQEFVTADYALRLPWRPWPISELFREGTKAESGESTSDEASTSTGVGSSEGHTVAGQAREEERHGADETVPLGILFL